MFTVDPSVTLVATIPGVLQPDACKRLIERIDDLGPELAPINTMAGTKIRTDVRNNERVMFDDAQLAEELCETAKGQAPALMRSRELVGANERFRCYRYKPGMRFAPHADGSFKRNENEKSFYTFLIYLNEDFVGGETNLATEPQLSIKPETGLGLIFQHPIVHEGAEVTAGTKYVARTDLMYRKIAK